MSGSCVRSGVTRPAERLRMARHKCNVARSSSREYSTALHPCCMPLPWMLQRDRSYGASIHRRILAIYPIPTGALPTGKLATPTSAGSGGGDSQRILYTTGSYLHAINARTGKPVKSFGRKGRVDLREGLPQQFADAEVIATTPGSVYREPVDYRIACVGIQGRRTGAYQGI